MKKITLITGAGRGIGEAIADKFAKENHDLILLVQHEIQKKKLEKIIKKKYNINIKVLVGDLNDDKFLIHVDKNIKYVNNLINNAAQANTDYFTKVSKVDLDSLIGVNLKSTFKLSQICAKKMIKSNKGGLIINISSQLGHVGAHNRTLYCMTKFGLEGLTKAMALDLAKHKIRVNTISPTKTIVNKNEERLFKKRLSTIKKKIPLGSFSTKEQIADIAFFLSTESAYSITGTSIISDGGWTAGK